MSALARKWACNVTLLRQGGSDGPARKFSVAGEHPRSGGLGLVQLCEWPSDESCFRGSRDHGADRNSALRPHWRAALLKQSDGRLRASSLPSNSATPPALMTVMRMMVGGHNCMQLELGRRSNQVESGLALDAYGLQSK
jgi:hypothetical protein